MQLELPFPPSVNHYYRIWRGHAVISGEGRAYRETVCAILAGRGVRPLTGPIRMRIEVFPPDNRRRDLDNLQKSLWDSLQHGGAYHDDSQVVRYEVEKFEVVPGGKVVVTIEEACACRNP